MKRRLEEMNNKKPFTLCFTGISGSGKSTLAREVGKYLEEQEVLVKIIDGDTLRGELGNLFGYTREDRMKQNRIVRVLAKYLNDCGINVIIAVIAPFDEMRKQMRSFLGENYIQAYLDCPVEECAKRDVKGYYKKAQKMENFIGVSDAYELPEDSEIRIDTVKEEVESSVEQIILFLKECGYSI